MHRSPNTAALVMCLTVPLAAQTMLVEPAAPLLPQQFAGWQAKAPAATGTDPAQADAARAAALQEDGLSRFATADYTQGTGTLSIRALQFVDATGAAAALSLYQAATPGLHPLNQKLGAEAAAAPAEVLFRSGNTVILASGPQPIADLQALAVTLPKIGGPKGMSPWLPTLLPAKGLAPESVRYSLGPTSYAANGGILPPEILGFTKAAEALTAAYTNRSGKGTLTLLLYPTPEIAGDRGRAVAAWLSGHGDGLGTVMVRREGPLVLMIAGSFPREEAQQMIENIHLRSEVTWEKKMPPEFHTEVRKTASLLVSISVLSGVLMLAAVLLGLFLGVGRASFRVLMGKPAASEPEFLGLNLERGPVKRLEHPGGTAIR